MATKEVRENTRKLREALVTVGTTFQRANGTYGRIESVTHSPTGATMGVLYACENGPRFHAQTSLATLAISAQAKLVPAYVFEDALRVSKRAAFERKRSAAPTTRPASSNPSVARLDGVEDRLATAEHEIIALRSDVERLLKLLDEATAPRANGLKVIR